MSATELYIDELDGRLHVAVVGKTTLEDLYADPLNKSAAWGSIYAGRVKKLDKRLDAAIVDLGQGLEGFLPAKHVHLQGGSADEMRSGIGDLLKNGQNILVQIKSEAKKGSVHERDKMPRLTTKIYVMGHHLVYCPLANPVTMSRNIARKDVLSMTAKLKAEGGWILQPHAEDADADVLKEEARKLLAEWQVIQGVKAESGKEPALLKGGPNALHRVLFDYGVHHFAHIHAGNRRIFDIAAQWGEKYDPPLATSKRLRLFRPEKPQQRLFDIHDIFGELEALKEDRVALPSGGSVIIEPTHALVVIDVNQGSAPSALAANEEAAPVVARQVRLRNFSGAIIVDCIGMDQRIQRARLVELYEDCFKGDAANGFVHGFTRIGIIEITRKRRNGWYGEILKV